MTNPSNQSELHQVAQFIRSQQPAEALKILTTYIKQNPTSEEAWYLLSFAVDDHQKKVFSLEQVLQLNPDNIRAQQRIHKLESKQKEITTKNKGTKKSKSRRWITYPLSFLVLTLIILGGYFTIRTIWPNFLSSDTQNMEVANLPLENPTPTRTPTPPPTTFPSATPTRVPTEPPTPSLSPTEIIPTATEIIISPTPTREFSSPSAKLGQEMDDIQNQVSTIRELGILSDSHRYIIPEIKVHKILSEIFLSRNTKEEIKQQARILTVLGLIEPGYDLYSKSLNNIGEGLGGFYVPWTDELFVISENFGSIEKLIYAHEYVHALTDQHYQLGDIGVYPECLQETDRCTAITALIEGDATKLMYDWLTAYASEEDIAAIEESQFTPIDQVITSNDFPPSYMVRETYFKYFDGLNFVNYVFEEGGGWEAVNAVYDNFPATSEQILHPEKYFANETAIEVEPRPLEDTLGDEWEFLISETLGELVTGMVLGSSANYLIQLDPITAAEAATGWGGDSYQVFYRARSNQSILVVHWVWDSIAEGDEFNQALGEYLNRRYVGRKIEAFDTDCWTKINDHFSCMFTNGNESLWLLAPGLDDIENLLEHYPEFK
jgi:hypothetical protein